MTPIICIFAFAVVVLTVYLSRKLLELRPTLKQHSIQVSEDRENVIHLNDKLVSSSRFKANSLLLASVALDELICEGHDTEAVLFARCELKEAILDHTKELRRIDPNCVVVEKAKLRRKLIQFSSAP